MNDDTMSNQAASSNSADEAQKTIADGEHYSGGSTMLDAQIALSNNPDEPTDELVATNLNSNSERDEPNPELAAQNNNSDLEHS